MKNSTRILLAAALVLFGTSAWPFADGFEAHAQAQIKAISIDAATPVPVKDVKIDAAGLLTAKSDKPTPPIPPTPTDALPPGFKYLTTAANKAPTWADICYGGIYPRCASTLAPVGSVTGRTKPYTSGKEITGRVISVQITALDKNMLIRGDGSQSIPSLGYSTMAASFTTITVSRAKGDIAIGPGKCGSRASNPGVRFGPTAAEVECRFRVGESLWLNFAFVDPADPFNPAKNGCSHLNASGGTKCDRNIGVTTF